MAGKTIKIYNTTGSLRILKYRRKSDKQSVKYNCLPAAITEIPDAHWKILKKNPVIETLLENKDLVEGSFEDKSDVEEIEKLNSLPDGFTPDETGTEDNSEDESTDNSEDESTDNSEE